MGRVGRFLNRELLSPPYRWLPLAVFVYAVLSFLIHPSGAIRTGYLADPDDYMRLDQVINWLQGQGWHDLSHPRLSPGTHTIVHWARLLDLPLALLMLPFIKMLGMQQAALLASYIVPPVTFVVLLWLSVALAKPFVGADRANLAAPLTLFAPMTLMNFVPGRVDHHGYEVLVAAFGLLSLGRMVEDDRSANRYAVVTAFIFACGLWIGTEALPWVILFVACLALAAAWQGGVLLRCAALFGLAFTVATAAVLPLAVAPADYSSLALSWYSAADVVFAGLVAGMFMCGWLVGRIIPNIGGRLAVMAIFGLLAAAAFYFIVPGVMQGPFADYDDFDATTALGIIGEAQPLSSKLHYNPYNHLQVYAAATNALEYLLFPICSLIALGFATYRAAPRQRLLFLAHGVFLAVATALAVFWQMRVGWFMQFFMLAPLLYLVVAWGDKLVACPPGRRRKWARLGTFLVFDFLLVTVLIPSLASENPTVMNAVFFPAVRAPIVCPLRTATEFLMQPDGYGREAHTILSGGDEGPELLLRTKHKVIAANFNVAGNKDVYDFFGARDDATPQAIMHRWNADMILICRNFPTAYARLNHPHIGTTAFLAMTSDGKLNLVSNPEHPTLIERLARGPLPAWLKPVEIPGDKDYLLFETR